MTLHENIVPFHRDITFDFSLGTLTLPHALQSYTAETAAPESVKPGWDDVEDRRALDDYTAEEIAATLNRLYHGQDGATPTRRAFMMSDAYPNSRVSRWGIASQLPSVQGGVVRPSLALTVNQFGAVLAPDSQGRMALGAVIFIADAPTLYARYRLDPREHGIDELFARLGDDIYGVRNASAVTVADNEKGVYKTDIYPKLAAGDPAGTIVARVHKVSASWVQVLAFDAGRVVLQPSLRALTRDSLPHSVFTFQVTLPEPRRDQDGRVTERLPNRSTSFWRRLEMYAKTAELLKQEERLIKTGAGEVH